MFLLLISIRKQRLFNLWILLVHFVNIAVAIILHTDIFHLLIAGNGNPLVSDKRLS